MARKSIKTILFVFFLISLALLLGYYRLKFNTLHAIKTTPLSSNHLILHSEDIFNSSNDSPHISWSDRHGNSHQLPLGSFFSKAFSSSSYSEESSQIIPYYYKAENTVDVEDITVVTLLTPNRILNLERLAVQYQGPISATMHITDDKDGRHNLMLLNDAMKREDALRKYVDIHLIRDEFDRELNLWRNIAKIFARTEYIMQLDIDFYPCTKIRKSVLKNKAAMSLLRTGEAALVIPAFEYSSKKAGLDYKEFPTSKSDLIEMYNAQKLKMFHSYWQPGHAPTDYETWTSNKADSNSITDELYKVTTYQHSYEPYVIFKKQGSPWCDERFTGYGSNKAACLFELYISGVNFYVLPDDFVIHQNHKYPEEARGTERIYNRRLYAQFREEICIRLGRRFIAQKKWDHPKSKNLRNECAETERYIP